MNPSPAAIATIKAHVTDWSQSDAAILAACKVPVANPTPQGQVPRVMSFADFLGMVQAGTISQASLVKVWLHSRFDRFYDDVMGGNNAAVAGLYPVVFAADGTLSQAEAGSLAAYTMTPALDPTWSATLPWDVVTIGREIDAGDVGAVRATL